MLFRPAGRAYIHTMRRRSTKDLQDGLRHVGAELEAVTKRSDVNAAAKKVMRAKEALKAAEEAAELG